MGAKPVRRKLVLAVEDDPVIRRAIEKALRTDVKVQFATTGKAAFEALADHAHPAFVLLDFMLPDTDGLAVVTRLRAEPRTRALPVVIFSSTSDPERVRAAMAAGANSWVRKTDDPKAFAAAVQAICAYWLDLNAHH